MDGIDFRKYSRTDREPLLALWRSVFPEHPAHNEPAAMLDAKLKADDLVFVAVDGVRVVGACMAGYDGHRGWLYAVAVLPEYRRGGIGSGLVRFAVRELAGQGCGKVNLQIRSGNTEVSAFYRSLGFTIEERLSMGLHLLPDSE